MHWCWLITGTGIHLDLENGTIPIDLCSRCIQSASLNFFNRMLRRYQKRRINSVYLSSTIPSKCDRDRTATPLHTWCNPNSWCRHSERNTTAISWTQHGWTPAPSVAICQYQINTGNGELVFFKSAKPPARFTRHGTNEPPINHHMCGSTCPHTYPLYGSTCGCIVPITHRSSLRRGLSSVPPNKVSIPVW